MAKHSDLTPAERKELTQKLDDVTRMLDQPGDGPHLLAAVDNLAQEVRAGAMTDRKLTRAEREREEEFLREVRDLFAQWRRPEDEPLLLAAIGRLREKYEQS